MWPYTYDSCDVGTAPNQTLNGLPIAATVNGDQSEDGVLSFLPGQRLSRCTCAGESHPGPKHSDGTFVGRSAPEIDIFEAQVRTKSTPPSTAFLTFGVDQEQRRSGVTVCAMGCEFDRFSQNCEAPLTLRIAFQC